MGLPGCCGRGERFLLRLIQVRVVMIAAKLQR